METEPALLLYDRNMIVTALTNLLHVVPQMGQTSVLHTTDDIKALHIYFPKLQQYFVHRPLIFSSLHHKLFRYWAKRQTIFFLERSHDEPSRIAVEWVPTS